LHSDSYFVTDPQALVRTVNGYTTADLQLVYQQKENGLRVTAGVQNAFDAEFPFADTQFGVASERVDFRRRVAFLELSKEFAW